MREYCQERGVVAFVGDGVNDVPVMRTADIGFAMGSLGSDAAIEAADVIITDDNLNKIDTTIQQAKRIIRIANQKYLLCDCDQSTCASIRSTWYCEYVDGNFCRCWCSNLSGNQLPKDTGLQTIIEN